MNWGSLAVTRRRLGLARSKCLHQLARGMAATQPTAEAWVVSGTCGWSDDSIMRCGRFYPRGISSATDRLPHFATRFATVEIDSSTYAIPTMDRVAQWVGKTPDGFRFSIKVRARSYRNSRCLGC